MAESVGEPRNALARILDIPHLARIVPHLQPELLHRVIERYGLEDCGELIALATSEQLSAVLDLDLWRSARPGLHEQLDAERFGAWLEVFVDAGAELAAERLAAMDVALMTAGFAQHIRVFDPASQLSQVTDDGDELPIRRLDDDHVVQELGGYIVLPRRPEWWDAVVAALIALDAERPDCFHRVMGGCRRLSNSTPEVDGLHDLPGDGEQILFDVGVGRERRREGHGYITVEQARAFLDASRQVRLEDATAPLPSPIAAAYLRAIEFPSIANATAADGPRAAPDADGPNEPIAHVAALVDALVDAGVLQRQQPRALIGGGDTFASRLGRIQALIQSACVRDETACARRHEELAFLANAIVAACTIQDRPFTPEQASDAATAVCNLGLENWLPSWSPALDDDFLVAQDLVRVFQVGWTVLHRQVCLPAAESLLALLGAIRCDTETQAGLDALRRELVRCLKHGAPWQAHDAFDVLAILDTAAWASLLMLTGECPAIHRAMTPPRKGVRAIDPSAFDFISENGQIAAVRHFLASLPERLRS
jgi:hypothetical protein